MHFLLATPAVAQVQLPELSSTEPITITAQAGNQWQLGSFEVWVLRGSCVIEQGQSRAQCREAVLWIDRADATERQPNKVIAYLEGDVKVALKPGATHLEDQAWLGRFYSNMGVEVRTTTTAGKPDTLPSVYWRGMERRSPETVESGGRRRAEQVQYTTPSPMPGPVARPDSASALPGPVASPTARPGAAAPALGPIPAGGQPTTGAATRQIHIYPRGSALMPFKLLEPPPGSNQWIAVIDGGVNAVVAVNATVDGHWVGTIDIATERLVVWTTGIERPNVSGGMVDDGKRPIEFYMEGNVEFREGERIIRADSMYYDVTNQVGTVINAELLTPVPNYQGLLRLHASVLQQTAPNRFYGKDVFMTSSRMGEPGYRLQAGDVYFEDIQKPLVDAASGLPLLSPDDQTQMYDHQRQATASNNFLFIGPVPIFYWPVLSTDLNDPTYYIRRAQVKSDNVYGMQILTKWSGYELLGIRNAPKDTDFGVTLDYLGKRGFGHGGSFSYDRDDFFDLPIPTAGLADFWGIQDRGTDNLGQGRSDVPPEKSYRYRLFWQHRQQLPYDLQLTGELGWISDRNMLEEYYKQEWDELKDESTGLELKRLSANSSWSITADGRINDFFTQTEWLPRADHFWIGQSLFNDTFTWYEHSNVGYAQFERTTIPNNVIGGIGSGAAGPFNYLPWELDAQGERLATRQEIDWPFQLGAVKVVPYALGEAAHWGQDVNGESLDRLFGQAGIRASMPMWSVDPTACSDLLNVHGIAHKVVFDAEFSYAQANRDLEDLPLYDSLDDDSVEAFRRRFLTTTYGLPSMSLTPTGKAYLSKFDERLYALRTGLQSWVTSPSTEIADDLTTIRLGAHQRWQTKRGPVNDRHIIDWITLDTNLTLYPDASRDNFGSTAGLFDYNFRWHVGDRLTMVSDAIFDFFDQGQKVVSVGGFLNRPPRGSLYLGFRVIEGSTNLDSKVLSLSYSYWMSPKWISSFGTSIDLGSQGNIGQNFSITRVGESLLVSAGFNVDAARNNVGVSLIVEPRFFKSRLSNVSGAEIPPSGAFGLE